MGKVVLTPALEAEFSGLQSPMEVCNAHGQPIGLFLPVGSYERFLANLEIPYSKEELERRRQEKGGSTLEQFWRKLGQT